MSTLVEKAGGNRVYLALATELLKRGMATVQHLPPSLAGLYEIVFQPLLADSGGGAIEYRPSIGLDERASGDRPSRGVAGSKGLDLTRRLLVVLLEAREPLTLRELQLLRLDEQRWQLPLWGSVWFEA